MLKTSGFAVMAVTLAAAGCVPAMESGYSHGPGYYNSGYPSGSYYNSSYSRPPTYYSSPTYYSTYAPPPRVVTQTRYVPVPAQRTHHHKRWRDRDRDGIPDRWERR
ncbi:MAG: hypothetical protein KIT25_19915 [Enhydrobacter sp.]|nr:MAG: hypothetical protein KIT25_19915 [Enhydrobacter sp.]